HMTTCIVYEVIQFIDAPDFILYGVQVGWMLVHGIPPVIYSLFNSSIRSALRQMAKSDHSQTVAASRSQPSAAPIVRPPPAAAAA
ncbi:hypothetical protein PFISCL1PPCAC_13910, partial [Pristionchus fissidentatus]